VFRHPSHNNNILHTHHTHAHTHTHTTSHHSPHTLTHYLSHILTITPITNISHSHLTYCPHNPQTLTTHTPSQPMHTPSIPYTTSNIFLHHSTNTLSSRSCTPLRPHTTLTTPPFNMHTPLASFPGHLHLQFLITCSMQKQRETAWGISSHDPRHS